MSDPRTFQQTYDAKCGRCSGACNQHGDTKSREKTNKQTSQSPSPGHSEGLLCGGFQPVEIWLKNLEPHSTDELGMDFDQRRFNSLSHDDDDRYHHPTPEIYPPRPFLDDGESRSQSPMRAPSPLHKFQQLERLGPVRSAGDMGRSSKRHGHHKHRHRRHPAEKSAEKAQERKPEDRIPLDYEVNLASLRNENHRRDNEDEGGAKNSFP